MSVFVTYLTKNAQCGIPVLMWNSVHLSLFVVNSICKLFQIYVIRYHYSHRACYNISTSLIVNLAMTGWLVYGNVIYFSSKNDCGGNI